jgi:hypothetical protein
VGGVVVRDQVGGELGENIAVEVIKEREKFLMAWRGLHCVTTARSSTLSAAKRVVVPCR